MVGGEHHRPFPLSEREQLRAPKGGSLQVEGPAHQLCRAKAPGVRLLGVVHTGQVDVAEHQVDAREYVLREPAVDDPQGGAQGLVAPHQQGEGTPQVGLGHLGVHDQLIHDAVRRRVGRHPAGEPHALLCGGRGDGARRGTVMRPRLDAHRVPWPCRHGVGRGEPGRWRGRAPVTPAHR